MLGPDPQSPSGAGRTPAFGGRGSSRPLPFGSTVLVVYEHFGVATAVAQRIMEFAAVELARTQDALAHLEQRRGYDLVVLCPYIKAPDREELMRRSRVMEPQPIAVNLLDGRRSGLLELCDPATGASSDVSTLNADPRRAAAVDLLTALSRSDDASAGTSGPSAVPSA